MISSHVLWFIAITATAAPAAPQPPDGESSLAGDIRSFKRERLNEQRHDRDQDEAERAPIAESPEPEPREPESPEDRLRRMRRAVGGVSVAIGVLGAVVSAAVINSSYELKEGDSVFVDGYSQFGGYTRSRRAGPFAGGLLGGVAAGALVGFGSSLLVRNAVPPRGAAASTSSFDVDREYTRTIRMASIPFWLTGGILIGASAAVGISAEARWDAAAYDDRGELDDSVRGMNTSFALLVASLPFLATGIGMVTRPIAKTEMGRSLRFGGLAARGSGGVTLRFAF